jgi:hypothetical protein
MSDTPRTDAQIYTDGQDPMVHADFARELERENAKLRAQVLDLADQPPEPWASRTYISR